VFGEPIQKLHSRHGVISKKLNEININISLSHQKPFPNMSLLSTYRFKKRFVKICENGDI